MTVNRQSEARLAELEATNNDLRNFLASTDMATVFLDRGLRIRRFTPATTRLLRLIPTDLGRPISDVVHNINDEHLLADAEHVLRDLTPIQREVLSSSGPITHEPDSNQDPPDREVIPRCYLRRLLPYRTEDDRIDGVVITFTDISEIKLCGERLRTARDYAESIVETVREPLLVLDQELRVRSANHAFHTTFATTPEETNGELLCQLTNGQWKVPALGRLLMDVLPTNTEFRDLEVTWNFIGWGWRTMQLNARAIHRADGKPDLMLLAFEDVTDRFQHETAALALREQERMGRDLHDSLGQQTTAIGLRAASLHRQLQSNDRPEADLAGKLLELVEQTKANVRVLARGLLPVELDADGLVSALAELACQTNESHGVPCRFDCDTVVAVDDRLVATHLFLIAKEAVHNAVKHARAGEIRVSLVTHDEVLTLEVCDNGVGMVDEPPGDSGLGIRIMRHRATLIDGEFKIESGVPHGTVVTCTVTITKAKDGRT